MTGRNFNLKINILTSKNYFIDIWNVHANTPLQNLPKRHSLSKNEIRIRAIKSISEISGYPFLDDSLNSLTHSLHTELYRWMYIKCYQETCDIMDYDVYVFLSQEDVEVKVHEL